ncbi:sulfate adenylyltransferase subunit CysN [Halopseudomonas phragmitis]|uniref:Multifunctional fusion protein n=1 Tax=Halopseudomonas phragmitis TaxID=1931241 RepID=A0A1V0B978_9GAMM|nr:sulfate adenylyltransferase subunit CysN [Halopseudomonas phragmitis]AQZ96489.1 adenylyl-sulfate kinase [Halopseudomonas phragmitis]
MAHVSDLIAKDIDTYLQQHEHKSLLRFITCGSVDDGKSTLIGRLLFESKMLFEDQLAAVEADSRKFGTQGDDIDFALLVDGLAAEREQGITIDVAYRFFSTDKRKFIVADTPGHEQYTRNMVTGASTADAAILMVDARKGILTQTRRHSYLVSMLGTRHVIVAINKMDLVDYQQLTYEQIVADYRRFAADLGMKDVIFIPLSAFKGDNIVEPSTRMPWYKGPTLMQVLEQAEIDDDHSTQLPFRLPVQWVNRPHLDFRGYCGMVTSGRIKPGDRVRVQPSGKESTVAAVVTMDGELSEALAGQSVTLTLTEELDISRGDVISSVTGPAEIADQFECTLVWMHDSPLLPGRPYLLKIGTRTLTASVTEIKHQVNINTLDKQPAKSLELNAIGLCNLSLDRAIAFDPYADNRDMGSFILIDRFSNNTVGAGLINFALRRANNIHQQPLDVNKAARAQLKLQKGCVLWFTGLSGAGKSAIANAVEKRLFSMGQHTYLLDGDNVRHGLNKDLGFTDVDRVENIRRIAEVSKLMVDAGLIVLTAFISPFRAERDMARTLVESDEFIEIFVDTPLDVAEQRDVKGLYRKARKGELKNFTGLDSPYEAPQNPDLRIDTTHMNIDSAADLIIDLLKTRKVVCA